MRNLAQEIYAIIREARESRQVTYFTRKEFLAKIPARFYHYDGLNVRKRLYDVLNIFIAIKYLRKEGSKFYLNSDEPGIASKGKRGKSPHQNADPNKKDFTLRQREFLEKVNQAVGSLESYSSVLGREDAQDRGAGPQTQNDAVRY